MKIKKVHYFFIFFTALVILLAHTLPVVAQPQHRFQPQCVFNFQFVLDILWQGNQTQQPILPGETREVNLTIYYGITRGLFGKIFLQLLKGGSFPIQLSVEDTPEWCVAWIDPTTITGIIDPGQIQKEPSRLFIHLNEDAPTNFTLGWVEIRGSIDDKKGPFNIMTLIHGYQNDFTLHFITGP
jgi:hypothetical protein